MRARLRSQYRTAEVSQLARLFVFVLSIREAKVPPESSEISRELQAGDTHASSHILLVTISRSASYEAYYQKVNETRASLPVRTVVGDMIKAKGSVPFKTHSAV